MSNAILVEAVESYQQRHLKYVYPPAACRANLICGLSNQNRLSTSPHPCHQHIHCTRAQLFEALKVKALVCCCWSIYYISYKNFMTEIEIGPPNGNDHNSATKHSENTRTYIYKHNSSDKYMNVCVCVCVCVFCGFWFFKCRRIPWRILLACNLSWI